MKNIFLDFTELFIGVSSFLYLIVGLLLWKNTQAYFKLSNRILSVFFIIIAYNAFTYLLITSGYIHFIPYLYKVAFPLNYLPYPLVYLYIRIILTNQPVLRKTDWLHGIPFLLAVIDYLPFYLIPIKQKSLIVDKLLHHFTNSFLTDQGFIPVKYHFIARAILGALYCFLMLRSLHLFKGSTKQDVNNYHFPQQVQKVIRWANVLTFWMIFIYLSYFLSVFLIELDNSFIQMITPIGITLILTSASILAIAIHIFLHPNVLYGIPEIRHFVTEYPISTSDSVSPATTIKKSDKKSNEDFNWEVFQQQVQMKQSFRKAGITVTELAATHDLSPRNLSFLIKHYSQLSFQDYINHLRIEYVLSSFREGNQQKHTLEAIGIDAGFGSKSAFFYTFKRIKGCTPGEYLQQESTS